MQTKVILCPTELSVKTLLTRYSIKQVALVTTTAQKWTDTVAALIRIAKSGNHPQGCILITSNPRKKGTSTHK